MNETWDRYYLKLDMVDYGEDLEKFDIRLDSIEKCLEIFEKILAYESDIILGLEFDKLNFSEIKNEQIIVDFEKKFETWILNLKLSEYNESVAKNFFEKIKIKLERFLETNREIGAVKQTVKHLVSEL
ncbi:hypothetical protein HXK64_02580 [Candidatus Gracilibacteria bacterium]|nr:hypothetical protein [Candidatus Gracilibacteria bacterium]